MMALAMMSFVGIAQAAGLNVTHQVISQQATAAGSDMTIKFGIENQTASALTGVSIELNDPMIMVNETVKAFNFASLAIGELVTVEGTVASSTPMLPVGSPIQAIIRGTDSAGQQVSYVVTSVEGVIQ